MIMNLYPFIADRASDVTMVICLDETSIRGYDVVQMFVDHTRD